jgi:hypothetical protein
MTSTYSPAHHLRRRNPLSAGAAVRQALGLVAGTSHYRRDVDRGHGRSRRGQGRRGALVDHLRLRQQLRRRRLREVCGPPCGCRLGRHVLQPDASERIHEWVDAASRACACSPAAAPRTSTRASSTIQVRSPHGSCVANWACRCASRPVRSACRRSRCWRGASRASHHPRPPRTPEVADGAPYAAAQSLFDLAPLSNIYLKLTPRIFGDVKKEKASAETFFPRVVEAFGAKRMAWGSNYPTSTGTLPEILAKAQAGLACLSDEDRAWIFGKTAQQLYPALA